MADALRVEIPLAYPLIATTPGYTTFDLKNASANAVASGTVFQFPYAESITHVGYRQGATTGTPASGSYKIGIYTVDGSGLPTATDIGGGSPTAATFQPASGNDGTFVWVALTNAFTPTRGQLGAIVLENNANTSANGITVAYAVNAGAAQNMGQQGVPYGLTFATPTWTKDASVFRAPCFGYKSASRVFGTVHQSGTARTVATTGQRVACRFTIPSTWCTSFKVVGFRAWMRGGAAASLFNVGLWDASSTLQSISNYDSDVVRNATTSTAHEFFFTDTTLATLTAGTTYYIGFESVSNSTVGMTTLDFGAANDLLSFGNGGNACYASYNSGWTPITTSNPQVMLILDDITPPSGSGGIIRPVPMSGGFV